MIGATAVSNLSRHADTATAVGELVGGVLDAIGTAPTLAVLFATDHHRSHMAEASATIQTLLDPAAFIGSSACGVLAGMTGVEHGPGLSLWAAKLPGTPIPFHLQAERDGDALKITGIDHERLANAAAMILIPDPFSFPTSEFVADLSARHPHLNVIGGMASAARSPGDNRLVIGGRVVSHGAIGVLLDQASAPISVVSQGCRPIGDPYTVTKSSGNVLFELGGKAALERLTEIVNALEPADQQLAAQGLHCGIVIDEHRDEFRRGDFLIRAVTGADRARGALAIGDLVPVGATVQFQVRDAATAGEDLWSLLASSNGGNAALVFTCNGRGLHMFGDSHHDALIVEDFVQGGAVGGMFCAGEIGPVAGRTALHGFTASVALFQG